MLADVHLALACEPVKLLVVTFLDCGMVGELTVTQRAHLVMLLWTFVHGSLPAMADQLRALSVPFRGQWMTGLSPVRSSTR